MQIREGDWFRCCRITKDYSWNSANTPTMSLHKVMHYVSVAVCNSEYCIRGHKTHWNDTEKEEFSMSGTLTKDKYPSDPGCKGILGANTHSHTPPLNYKVVVMMKV